MVRFQVVRVAMFCTKHRSKSRGKWCELLPEVLKPRSVWKLFTSVSSQASIAGGGAHTLAVKSDGTMLAWGRDSIGQLGDKVALEQKPRPVAVNGLTNIIVVAAGQNHSLALKSNGTVYAWGDDADGQLGDDPVSLEQPIPVLVSGINNIVAIAAGGSHSLALNQNDGYSIAPASFKNLITALFFPIIAQPSAVVLRRSR